MRAPLAVLLVVAAVVTAAGCALGEDGSNEGVAATPKGRPPVVLLVLDEFPADTLLTPDGEIDAERFPNFAALARTSTWFRNGQTVYDSTFKAVPAILDARMPRRGTAPDVRSHQPSLFHLLDRHGYDVVKVESGTAVCPPRICAGARTRRPGVLARLAGGGRPARLQRWIGAIRSRPRPTFYFQHALLPHEPWLYLPSGHQNRPKGSDPIPGVNRPGGFSDPGLTEHNQLRHLLQVGYVDRQLGLLMRRMRRTGVFDRALVVVVADHGYSFELNVPGRRQVRDTNIDEVAGVPFFLKRPGQSKGEVDESIVRNIDIVPTVADVLGVDVWWRHDGHSAFSEVTRARDVVAMPRRDFSRVVSVSRERFEAMRDRRRRGRAARYGTGAESVRQFGDPWAAADRIGPHQELLGRRVAAGTVAPARTVRGAVANADLLAQADRDDRIWPTRIAGEIRGGPPGASRPVAVAVNGRIRAVGRSFHLRGRAAEYFSLLVPEDAIREGRNPVELFEVGAGGRLRLLAAV